MKRYIHALLLAFLAFPAYAADHTNLEENLPTELEDAYTIGYRGREIQGIVRYIEEGGGQSRWVYQPILEVGIFRNTQLNVAGTFYSGNADRKGRGDVSSELLYNFNTESIWMPATALAVKGEFPTGKQSNGVDVTTKVILSKMPFVRTTLHHRLHANLIWKHNSGRDEATERSDMFKGIIGFSVRAGKDSNFIVDYIREQTMEKDKDANVLEAGFRRQMTPFTVLSIGAGAGIGEDSENYRITFGFQHAF